MRQVRFTGHQIIAVLKSVEAGRTVKDIFREAAISETNYYNWKAKYGGMEATGCHPRYIFKKPFQVTHRQGMSGTLNVFTELTAC